MKLSQANLIRILTAILTPVGAGVTAWGAKSGLQLPGAAVVTVGAGAGAAILLMGWHWLQKNTKVEQVLTDAEKLKNELISAVTAAVPAAGPALSDIEAILKSHTVQILTAVGNAVHAPPSAQEVAQQILGIAAGNAQGGSSTPDPTGAGSGSSAPTDPGSTSQAPADPVPVPPAPLSAG